MAGRGGGLAVCLLLLCLAGMGSGAPGDVVQESRFVQGTEGWVVGVEGKGATDGGVVHDRGMKRIKAGDAGDVSWYFEAPKEYLGRQDNFYHATLNFSLGHFIYDRTSGGVDTSIPDVIMTSKKHRLGAVHVFKSGVSTWDYSVPFTAEAFEKQCVSGSSSTGVCVSDGGKCVRNIDCCSQQCVGGKAVWMNLKSKQRATNIEILETLGALTSLKIRGGYYPGGVEKTWLRLPTIREGSDFNVTEAANAPAAPLTANTQRRSQASCSREERVVLKLNPPSSVESTKFNTRHLRPWSFAYTFENVPPLCSDVVLTVEAEGDLVGEDKHIKVRTGDGRQLGSLFKTFGDGAYDARACPGAADGESCTIGINGSVYMAGERILGSSNFDGLVIPRTLSTAMASTGSFTVVLFVDPSNPAESVLVRSLQLSFPLGGCYRHNARGFPIYQGQPRRYSGYFHTLTFPSPPPPDDAAAFYLNMTGIIAPESVTVLATYGDVVAQHGDPGTWGPRFMEALSNASQSDIVATGEDYTGLAPMARVFADNYGQSPPFGNQTLAKGVAVPRASLTAALAGVASAPMGAPGDLKASLFLTGAPDESSHPGGAVLHEAGLIYPPKSCFVRTLKQGMNLEGLRGPPINRELLRCSDRWKCDSIGLTNNAVYEGLEACEQGCVVQPGSVKGRCYRPFSPEGTCANAARSCGCSQEGHAFCLDAGVTRMAATGSCRCVPDQWCEGEPINASLPYAFDGLPTPVGDVTVYLEASVPYPFDPQVWLRLRLTEGDGRTLGHFFGAPDCSSSDCRLPYTLNDATTPLVDHVTIPMPDALRFLADGRLEFALELDAPRPDLACGLHPYHERCFPGMSEAEAVARVYKSAGQTELSAALDAALTGFSVASASAAGIVPGEYIRVDDELMLVTAVAANALTVQRGAAGSTAAAHRLGTCSCTDYSAACETAASYAACDAATPAKIGNLPVPVPWTPNSVRVVDPVILPGLFNGKGEVTLRAVTISYATA